MAYEPTEAYDTGLHGYLVKKDDDVVTCLVNQATLDRIAGMEKDLSTNEKVLIQLISEENHIDSIVLPADLHTMGTILFDGVLPEQTDNMTYEKICIVIAKVRKKGESECLSPTNMENCGNINLLS